jgi:hypothetical protein
MRQLLVELEARMNTLPPADRERLTNAIRQLGASIGASTSIMGGLFRPSRMATLKFLTDLVTSAGGGVNLVAKAKKLAPAIGPHVTAILQTL